MAKLSVNWSKFGGGTPVRSGLEQLLCKGALWFQDQLNPETRWLWEPSPQQQPLVPAVGLWRRWSWGLHSGVWWEDEAQQAQVATGEVLTR